MGVVRIEIAAMGGKIKKIYCENFMCHRRLTIDFIENVNFITGRNGSGKSAILAALQICLGAKARNTHRASKCADLIRKGFSGRAIVEVTITNPENNGYNYATYGNIIRVQRSICHDTPGGYKLFGEDGKCKSTRKPEIDAICEYFNIQVWSHFSKYSIPYIMRERLRILAPC